MGLFDSDSDDDNPLFGASSEPASTKSSVTTKGGLFDGAGDAGSSSLAQPTHPNAAGGGLFGDESESDSEPPVKAPAPQTQQQQPKPAPAKSGGLFGDSSDEEEDGGSLMTAAAPAPKPAALMAKRSDGGLFGDDSGSDSDAAGLFGGSSKPGDGSKATIAPAGLFANDAPSDDDGGLFGSAAEKNSREEEVSTSGQWDQSSVGRLIDMGFARVDVEAALTAKDGDVQQAADWLLVGGTAAAVDRTSVSSTGDDAAESSNVDGGLDQSSAFHGTCRQGRVRRGSRAACTSTCACCDTIF
eukprot:COSAG02_NODE_12507_length_1535_cov_1.603064_2_plen_299_part_00